MRRCGTSTLRCSQRRRGPWRTVDGPRSGTKPTQITKDTKLFDQMKGPSHFDGPEIMRMLLTRMLRAERRTAHDSRVYRDQFTQGVLPGVRCVRWWRAA